MNSRTQQHAHRSTLASGPAGPGILKAVGGVLLLALVAFIAIAAGCSDEQIEQYRAANAEIQTALDEANTKLDGAETLLTELDGQIAATPDGPEKLAAVEARDRVAGLIEKTKATADELDGFLEQNNAAISAALAGNTAQAVTIGGRYIATKVPQPYGVYVLAGSTVLGGILTYLQKRKADEAKKETNVATDQVKYLDDSLARTRDLADKTRDAAASVITAIEYEKGSDGTVDFADDATQASLRSRMSTEARDMVEVVRRAQPARVKALKAMTTSGT